MNLDNENYYEILGVGINADGLEIRKRYKKLVIMLHPDKNKSQDAEEKMKLINNAYHTLKDPDLKNKYDEGLKRAKVKRETKNGMGKKGESTTNYSKNKFYYHNRGKNSNNSNKNFSKKEYENYYYHRNSYQRNSFKKCSNRNSFQKNNLFNGKQRYINNIHLKDKPLTAFKLICLIIFLLFAFVFATNRMEKKLYSLYQSEQFYIKKITIDNKIEFYASDSFISKYKDNNDLIKIYKLIERDYLYLLYRRCLYYTNEYRYLKRQKLFAKSNNIEEIINKKMNDIDLSSCDKYKELRVKIFQLR